MIERGIFVDTAGWAHLLDRTQKHHHKAVSLYKAYRDRGVPFITTNYIIAELVALLTSPLKVARPKLVRIIDSIRTSPYVHIVHVSPQLDEKAWGYLKRHLDKNWSLVDCVSFVVMEDLHIRLALTSDRHFEQAGFTILLKS